MPDTLEFTIAIRDDKILPPAVADTMTQRFLNDLRIVRVESATRLAVAGQKQGAKSPEALTIGSIAVAVVPEVLKDLIQALFDWVRSSPSRTITIRPKRGNMDNAGGNEIELTGKWSPAELKVLSEALLKADKPLK